MIKGTKEYCDRVASQYECPEHGAKLVTAWYAEESTYIIRCGEGHYPEEIRRINSPTQEYKEGSRPAHSPGLDLMVRKDLGNDKDLSAAQIVALLRYADKYGLDAYRGHVVMMYGKPYIGIDGYLYHAYKQAIPYSLTGRPLADEELKLRGYQAGDLGYLSRVKRLDTEAEFEGVGFVTREEIDETVKDKPGQKRYPIVADKPGYMVQKRADWQALRRAFPIGEEKEETIEARDQSSISP